MNLKFASTRPERKRLKRPSHKCGTW
jgi:hypothetical protein